MKLSEEINNLKHQAQELTKKISQMNNWMLIKAVTQEELLKYHKMTSNLNDLNQYIEWLEELQELRKQKGQKCVRLMASEEDTLKLLTQSSGHITLTPIYYEEKPEEVPLAGVNTAMVRLYNRYCDTPEYSENEKKMVGRVLNELSKDIQDLRK